MYQHLSLGIWLVDVVEAAQVHTFYAQIAHADRGVLGWVEFHGQAGLYAIGIFVVSVETHDRGGPEKGINALREKRGRTRERVVDGAAAVRENIRRNGRRVGVRSRAQQAGQAGIRVGRRS